MPVSGAKPSQKRADDGYIPFKLRFLAWWEGVEPHTLIKRNPSPTDLEDAAASDAEASQQTESDTDHGQQIDIDVPSAGPALAWSKTRLDFASLLWGLDDEVVHPGGLDYCQRLVEPMSLCKGRRLLDLSAGLGGGARAICETSDADVDGFDLDPELAAHAMVLSIQRGLSERVPIKHLDQGAADFGTTNYDGVLSREILFQIADRDSFLSSLHTALKPRGHFVFTDFVLSEGVTQDDPDVRDWLDSEPNGGAPAPIDYYDTRLEILGFDLLQESFECDAYCRYVQSAWARFTNSLSKDDLNREFVSVMMLEAEFWMKRVKILNSGKVRLIHCHATKGGL